VKHLDIDDHAFASGPVYLRPHSIFGALRQTHGLRDALHVRAVWRQFEQGAKVGAKVRLGATARLINRNGPDAARIGDESVIRGILRLEPQGLLTIGSLVYVGDGCVLSAMEHVEIGSGTLLAHGVQIFDNDTHPIDAEDRVADFRKKLGYKLTKPIAIGHARVHIGRRCWLGMNSIVMKGVTIGDDTIVASGSVVVEDLPSSAVAAGNPARPVRMLTEE
jgi:acetyltransferase-like isoleucine patch superfamily enzyme